MADEFSRQAAAFDARPYLVIAFQCSAIHLSPSAQSFLTVNSALVRANPRNWTTATPYGWLVWAEEAADGAMPADLATILRHALEAGADYVLFDRDGPEHACFPDFGRPY